MKKLYIAVSNHLVGLFRILMVLLVPCAFNKHFAMFLLCFSVTLQVLFLAGRKNGWDEEVG